MQFHFQPGRYEKCDQHQTLYPACHSGDQWCGAGAGRSRYFLLGAEAGVKVRLRLHLR